MASCIDKLTKVVLRSRDLTVAPWNDAARYMRLTESVADSVEQIATVRHRVIEGGAVREATPQEKLQIDQQIADAEKAERETAEKERIGEGGELILRAVAEWARRHVNQVRQALIPPLPAVTRRQMIQQVRLIIDEGIDRDNGD